MSKFYLENIIESECSNTENAVAILQSRGFLIDYADGEYYLSDNATVNDAEFLKKGIENCNAGRVIIQGEYTISSRRDWLENRSYTYESLKPLQVRLDLNDGLDVNSLIAYYFPTDSSIGTEACGRQKSWKEYSIEQLPVKADVSILEPYIARYVKAISACGVDTWESCDGNEENQNAVYVRSTYPSCILHEYIWREIVQKKFGDIPFVENGIIFGNEESKIDTYCTINKIAGYLYENRMAIRKLKEKSLRGLSNGYINFLELNEKRECFYRKQCERVFKENDI